ncbi:hypothetical protein Tco_0966774 [Tanacetum coccineum]
MGVLTSAQWSDHDSAWVAVEVADQRIADLGSAAWLIEGIQRAEPKRTQTYRTITDFPGSEGAWFWCVLTFVQRTRSAGGVHFWVSGLYQLIPKTKQQTTPDEYNHLSGKSENSNSKVLEEGEMSANSSPHVNSSAVSKSKEVWIGGGLVMGSGRIDISNGRILPTWSPSASKMSKLDRFFFLKRMAFILSHLSAAFMSRCVCADLSDHGPILLKEVHYDFGPTPFRFFHSWLDLLGFDEMISSSWASFNLDDSNAMIRFEKKLKLLKLEIRKWTRDFKEKQEGQSRDLNLKLRDIDKTLDQGGVTDDLLLSRMELMKQIQDIHKSKHRDSMQKA